MITMSWSEFKCSFMMGNSTVICDREFDVYSTTMWNGLPGMCWSPHMTTRMWFPRSLGR
jgi:hypothetical protein